MAKRESKPLPTVTVKPPLNEVVCADAAWKTLDFVVSSNPPGTIRDLAVTPATCTPNATDGEGELLGPGVALLLMALRFEHSVRPEV
jgi:hypothetical protein